MPQPLSVINLSLDDFRAVLREEFIRHEAAKARAASSDTALLSLRAAARMARVRTETARRAAVAGTLKARKTAAGRNWKVQAAEVRRWVEAGAPAPVTPQAAEV